MRMCFFSFYVLFVYISMCRVILVYFNCCLCSHCCIICVCVCVKCMGGTCVYVCVCLCVCVLVGCLHVCGWIVYVWVVCYENSVCAQAYSWTWVE